MVTVPRITAVSYLDTIPFLYGIDRAAELREGLSLSDFDHCIRLFREGGADVALLPVHAIPSLTDARIVTEYCLAARPVQLAALLRAEPEAPVQRLFTGEGAPLASLLAADGSIPYALWVARADTDPAVEELLERALTEGMERIYEAVVEAGYDQRPYDAYAYLTHLDYVFDHEKRQALEKFWDAGLKVAPRANPG